MCSAPERLALGSLPIACTSAIGVLAPIVSRLVWQPVNVLITGAVLAPGTRTVTAMLWMMGCHAASDFQTSHRVLHSAIWSPLTASRLLRRRFVAVCIPSGGVVCSLDNPLERRRGPQSTAKGLSRDPVRSSHAHVVTGKRRPTLEAVVADERTQGPPVRGAPWYGEGPRAVEVATATAGWYHAGKPPVVIRGILRRAPKQAFTPQALLSTNLAPPPEQPLLRCVRRCRAIARTTPALLSLDATLTLTAQQLLEQGATCMRRTA